MGKYQSRKKKRKYKKIKGVKYLAYKLLKYYPSRYKTYTSALPRAKELLSQIKSTGERVNIKSFFKFQRKHRKPTIAPYLDDDLMSPDADNLYFNLGQIDEKIKTLSSNELFFQSTISDDDLPLIQGGKEQDVDFYKQYFSNFVNFLDQKRKSKEIDYDDIRIVCTAPEFDSKQKKWISKIVITDPNGNPLDDDLKKIIGEFNPNQLYLPTLSEIQKQEKETKKTKASAELEAQLKLEQEKSKTKKAEEEIKKAEVIKKALELLEKGIITHEQFDNIINKL
jgi:hypothetical protein